MSYVLSAEAFRAAHPELAQGSWLEGQHVCFTNMLTGKVEKIALGVPLCESCDSPLDADNLCKQCVETLPVELKRTGTGGWL